MNDMFMGMLMGMGLKPFFSAMKEGQAVTGGGGQPGGGMPPEMLTMIQQLFGQGGMDQGPALPKAPPMPLAPQGQPAPPLPPRFGPSATPGAPPIPGGRPAVALPPMTSSLPRRPIMPGAM